MILPGSPDTHPFDSIPPGTRLGPFDVTISERANRRYFEAAGVAHPALEAGALYPPIAANLTVLLFGQHCSAPVIQTRQRLVSHRRGEAGTSLVVTGEITRDYDKRGRRYVDVTASIAPAQEPDDPIWTSEVTFVPADEVSA